MAYSIGTEVHTSMKCLLLIINFVWQGNQPCSRKGYPRDTEWLIQCFNAVSSMYVVSLIPFLLGGWGWERNKTGVIIIVGTEGATSYYWGLISCPPPPLNSPCKYSYCRCNFHNNMTNFHIQQVWHGRPRTTFTLTLIVYMCFRKTNFYSCHRLRKYSNYQIYGKVRFGILHAWHNAMLRQ